MKQYHIFKDSTLVERTTARKCALDTIRRMQTQETHYLLRSEFSIIYGEEEHIPPMPDASEQNAPESRTPLATGERYHILENAVQYGAAPTYELACFMIQQARSHRKDAQFSIIRGTEEFIRYPKRRATQL